MSVNFHVIIWNSGAKIEVDYFSNDILPSKGSHLGGHVAGDAVEHTWP